MDSRRSTVKVCRGPGTVSSPLRGPKVGEWVNPCTVAQAFHALIETPGLVIGRVRDRTYWLMRHVRLGLPAAIRSLAQQVAQLSLRRRLIATTSCADLLSPHSLPTGNGAVALSPITALADREHSTATRITTCTEPKDDRWAACSGDGHTRPNNPPRYCLHRERAFGADDDVNRQEPARVQETSLLSDRLQSVQVSRRRLSVATHQSYCPSV